MRALLGFFIGVLFTYLCGALVSWDFNPGEWNVVWRFIVIGFAIFWGCIGWTTGMTADDNAAYVRDRRLRMNKDK